MRRQRGARALISFETKLGKKLEKKTCLYIVMSLGILASSIVLPVQWQPARRALYWHCTTDTEKSKSVLYFIRDITAIFNRMHVHWWIQRGGGCNTSLLCNTQINYLYKLAIHNHINDGRAL